MSLPEILRCNWEGNSSIFGKLGILVTMYLFSWDTEVFLCGVSWENDDILLSLMSWQAGLFKALINRGVLLNDWIFWKTQLFFIYYLHQNTWIPRWIISGKMTWEKKSVSCENNLSSRTGQPMSHMETWQERTPYFQITSQWLLLTKTYSYT